MNHAFVFIYIYYMFNYMHSFWYKLMPRKMDFFKKIIIKQSKLELVILVKKLDFLFSANALTSPFLKEERKKQRISDSISEKLVASFRQVLCYIHSSRCRILIDCTVLCMYVHGKRLTESIAHIYGSYEFSSFSSNLSCS